jgi:hypothetical protein
MWALLGVMSFLGSIGCLVGAFVALFKKKGLHKRYFIYSGSLFVLFIVAMVASPSTTTTTKEPLADSKASVVTASAPTPSKADAETKAKTDAMTKADGEKKAKADADAKAEEEKKKEAAKPIWPNIEVTEESVKAALATVKGIGVTRVEKINKVDIKGVENRGVSITVTPTKLSDDSFIDEMAHTIISYSETLFQNPDIRSVEVIGLASFVDQYGKSTEQEGALIAWDRDVAEKVDYKKFKEMTFSDRKRPFNIASFYRIHPGLLKSLKDKESLSTVMNRRLKN